MIENPPSLEGYVPDKKPNEKLELRSDLLPVVSRISEIIPPSLVWIFYSSAPNETGGRIIFPYHRVDTSLTESRDYTVHIRRSDSIEKSRRYYKLASTEAFKTLLWVEIGFQGLSNLLKSPAARNWSVLGSGSYSEDDNEEIIEKRYKQAKKLYENCLGEFAKYRKEKNIEDDLFSQFKAENLIYPFNS